MTDAHIQNKAFPRGRGKVASGVPRKPDDG